MAQAKNKLAQWFRVVRRVVVTFSALIVILVFMLVIAYQTLPVRQLHWAGWSFSLQQMHLNEVSFQTGQGQLWWDVRIRGLEITWRGWPLPALKLQQLQLAPQFSGNLPEPSTIHSEPTPATPFQLPSFPELNLPQWLPEQIEIAQLQLQLPCQGRIQLCQLQGSLQSDRTADDTRITIAAQGDGQQLNLQLEFMTAGSLVRQIHIKQLGLQLDVKALADANWVAGLPPGFAPETIQMQIAGNWQSESLQLNLQQPLHVRFRYKQPGHTTSVQLEAAMLTLDKGQLTCVLPVWQQCQFAVGGAAQLKQFAHSMLETSDWRWQGRAQGTLSELQLTGTIENPQSLKLSYEGRLSPSALSLQWQLADVFLLAGNPLQIMKFWPDLLELQRGKISARGELQLQFATGRFQHIRVLTTLNEVAGLYDRTAFSGLTTEGTLEGDATTFALQLAPLQLGRLQHGFEMGPLRLEAHYRGEWATPDRGEVRLTAAQLGIFGGQLAVAPVQFKLQQAAVEFQVAVQQIQLAALLQQHPSAKLFGEGVISGTIPLRYLQTSPLQGDTAKSSGGHAGKAAATSLAQWQVLGGQLQAEPPGGRLQYQYQPQPGQKPSGMDVAWQALDDFRYQTLASAVEFTPEGKLLLQVKLHGFNPKLQQGRPVHFNIHLEEDLPALLTSLQLSGQISDKVRQRIQMKLQQQSKPKTAQQTGNAIEQP